MAYNGCNYYSRINEVAMNPNSEERDAQMLQILDDELNGEEAEWLAHHFNSTSEWLLESCDGAEDDFGGRDHVVSVARREIELFRAHGYEWEANQQESWLNEYLNRVAEAL